MNLSEPLNNYSVCAYYEVLTNEKCEHEALRQFLQIRLDISEETKFIRRPRYNMLRDDAIQEDLNRTHTVSPIPDIF